MNKLRLLVTKAIKSKTLAIGYVVTFLGALYDNAPLLQQALPESYAGKVVAGLGLLMIVLRTFTSKPLDQK